LARGELLAKGICHSAAASARALRMRSVVRDIVKAQARQQIAAADATIVC
jgi:hypothetical protein